MTPDDIAFIRGAAMRRAEIGIALEDYLAAYRVGQLVLWDAMVACASDSDAGREAALTLQAVRFIDVASTLAGQAFVEFRQLAVAEADRNRRDLLEVLLTGELPAEDRCTSRHGTTGSAPDAGARGLSRSGRASSGRAR